ncbi:MAG: acetoacetyl-CoA reductase [Gammaproteobacteria bacterium]|nr:MAG: acetoacetyl-CoA reductase [Gammaproteobacteria bacterium]
MSDIKTALVTGGTGGIGTAICRALSKQGLNVVANYHPMEADNIEAWQAAQKADGFEFDVVPADVSSFDSCKEMIESLAAPVDVLVNCAGITRDASMKKMDVSQWDAVIRTNLDSVFNVTKQVFAGMTERGYGRVVNISSVNGQRGQFGQTNYSAAKAGMHGFTMALAQEGAAKGVTVNSVSPGYVQTAMTDMIPDEIKEAIIATVPMKRMGTVEEIADAVAYLTSDSAAYVTGQNLGINGGFFMS